MRVLQINSVCGIRSTGRICTDIAEILEKEGHECKIAYGREDVPDKYKKYSVRIGCNFDIYLNVLQSRIWDNTGFGSKYYTKRFVQWIKKYNPDIIHLHNIHGYYINIEILFKFLKEAEIPVIWTLHDCWAFTGHCAHFASVKCDKWRKIGCSKCVQKKEYPASYIRDNSKNNYEKKRELFTAIKNMIIVTPSNWLADLVKESFFKGVPVEVVNNGVDLSLFKPTVSSFRKKYKLENKIVLLGVASIWSEKKGFNDFCRLARMLSDEYRLVMVGVDDVQIKSLPVNVLCFKRTNSIKELAEIYSAADFFLNLSYEDTYPTVNLEAQACGTPVITYNTGGSIESVPEEMVVEQGDLNSILDLICRFKDVNFRYMINADKYILLYKYIELYDKIKKK